MERTCNSPGSIDPARRLALSVRQALVIGERFRPTARPLRLTALDPQTHYYDIWLYDLARGTASRFTFGPKINEFPVWSPDGSRIAFYSDRDNPSDIRFRKPPTARLKMKCLDKPHRRPAAQYARG